MIDKIKLEDEIGNCVGYLVVIHGEQIVFFETEGKANAFIREQTLGEASVSECTARVISRHGRQKNIEVWRTNGHPYGDFHFVSGPKRTFQPGTFDEVNAHEVASSLAEEFDQSTEASDDETFVPGGILRNPRDTII